MKITLKTARPLLKKLFKAGVVPYLHSSPAIGKSSVFHQIAAEYKLKVIDWRGSAADPTDLNGYPDLSGDFATYKPFDTFPTENSVVPTGFNGWLLIMDEFSSASRSVQSAAYKLVLDKQVGSHQLHKKVFICAAGNLDTDNAIVNPLSTALISRMCHMYVEPDLDAWTDWAIDAGISPTIISFLQWKKTCFYTFNSDKPKECYASPRTWEMVSKVEAKNGASTADELPLLAGLIGKGAATEYLAYLRLFTQIVTIDEIVANPTVAAIPEKQDMRYCITGMLSEEMTVKNCSAVCEYLLRMPTEFRLLCVRTAYKRTNELLDNNDFDNILDEYIKYIQ